MSQQQTIPCPELQPTKQIESEWKQLIRNTKVNQVIQSKKKIVTVKDYDSMGYILDVLKANDILSAPVEKEGKFLGFVDVLDIAACILHISRTAKRGLWMEDTNKKLAKRFNQYTAQQVLNFSGWDKYVSADENDSVEHVLDLLSMKAHRTHRVAVLNGEKKVVGIISQSDILRLANNHVDKIPLAGKSLKDLGLSKGCLMLKASTDFATALAFLSDHRVSGIAIVDDEQGKLVANFSAGDLRGFHKSWFVEFSASVVDFLRDVARTRREPVVLTPDHTLNDCIQAMVNKRVHRVYAVDEEKRPISVVSLTDLMSVLQEDYVPKQW